MSEVERTYYPDGSISSEVTMVNGLPHGVTRHWHPNGVLAHEIPLTNGDIEGTVRQWNAKGKLLGESTVSNGNGEYRMWHPNGNLLSEVFYVDGKFTGRQRSFFEDGELTGDIYWLDDKQVSRKRYRKACELNPKLPQYKDDAKPTKRKSKTQKERHRKQKINAMTAVEVNDLASKLLNGSSVCEALSWLTVTDQLSRSLGEATDQKDSVELVENLYKFGAISVFAVEIDGQRYEDQNTGRLVVELPGDINCRQKLLIFCGRLAEQMGYEPDTDIGQRYIILLLD